MIFYAMVNNGRGRASEVVVEAYIRPETRETHRVRGLL